MKQSLLVRLALIFGLAVSMLMLSAAGLQYSATIKQRQQELVAQEQLLLKRLQVSLGAQHAGFEPGQSEKSPLRAILRAEAEAPQVLGIYLYGTDNRLLASAGQQPVQNPPDRQQTLVLTDGSGEPTGRVEIYRDASYLATLKRNLTGLLLAQALLVTLLLVAAIVLILRLNLILPLGRLTRAMEDFASGAGDASRPARVGNQPGEDEIERLSRAYEGITVVTRTLVEQVAGLTDKLQIQAQNQATVLQINQDIYHQQHIAASESAVATEQMVETSETISAHLGQAAAASSRSFELGDRLRQEAEQSSQGLSLMTQRLAASGQSMAEVSQATQQIVGITDMIRDVAEQTNLLALNAAIEAARAGEQGRGFAVVADEVRSLAGRTQKNTQQIQSMVDRLHESSAKTVDAISASQQASAAAAAQLARSDSGFVTLTEQLQSMEQQYQSIAMAAVEQSVGSSQVRDSVRNIDSLADDALRTAEGLKETSQQISQLCQELEGNIQPLRF